MLEADEVNVDVANKEELVRSAVDVEPMKEEVLEGGKVLVKMRDLRLEFKAVVHERELGVPEIVVVEGVVDPGQAAVLVGSELET